MNSFSRAIRLWSSGETRRNQSRESVYRMTCFGRLRFVIGPWKILCSGGCLGSMHGFNAFAYLPIYLKLPKKIILVLWCTVVHLRSTSIGNSVFSMKGLFDRQPLARQLLFKCLRQPIMQLPFRKRKRIEEPGTYKPAPRRSDRPLTGAANRNRLRNVHKELKMIGR